MRVNFKLLIQVIVCSYKFRREKMSSMCTRNLEAGNSRSFYTGRIPHLILSNVGNTSIMVHNAFLLLLEYKEIINILSQ